MCDIDKAIKHFENMRDENYVVLDAFRKEIESGKVNGSTLVYDNRKMYYELAIKALKEKQARENPKPLTLDELMERDGKPVWVVDKTKRNHSAWHIVDLEENHLIDKNGMRWNFNKADWQAFDYEPHEVK